MSEKEKKNGKELFWNLEESENRKKDVEIAINFVSHNCRTFTA